MRIVFLASGAFAVPTLEWLRSSGHEVAAVVSQPSRPRGRGRGTTPTPTAECALRIGYEVIETPNVNTPEIAERLGAFGARLGVVIAFGQKLGPTVINAFACGCVNLHASLLPKYRGAAPINWAVLRGEECTGVTVFRLTDRIDAGAILVQRQTAIGPEETAGELHDRLSLLGPDAIGATIAMFEKTDSPAAIQQDNEQVSIAPKLAKEDGLLDFRMPAPHLARQVRALYPWPGARCVYRSAAGGKPEEVTLCRARPIEGDAGDPADVGRLTERLTTVTGQGELQVLEIQPAGKRVMAWQDFVNGRRVRPGDRFESLNAT
jgi:methionyl-tRNA formyltransferase